MKSQDNVSCMIVLMDGLDSAPAASPEPSVEFTPGSVSKLGDPGYRKAYEHMAERAGLTLVQAAAMRYDAHLALAERDGLTPELQEEAAVFGTPQGEAGSAEREAWFESWLQDLPEDRDDGGPPGMSLGMLMNMMRLQSGGA